MVRQGSAKPSFPGSNPGVTSNQNSRNACVSGVFSCLKAGFSLIFSLMRSALPVETVEKGGGRKLPSPSCGIGSILCRQFVRPCRLAQLCPRQGADDAVHTQTVGLLERQHGGLCLASEDAVHAAAVKSSRFRIGATVLTPSRLRCRMRTTASTPIRRTGRSFPAGRLETTAARPTSVKARTQSLLHSAGRKTLADAELPPYAVTALISYTGTAALLRRRKREA